jgi:hypothetical protein
MAKEIDRRRLARRALPSGSSLVGWLVGWVVGWLVGGRYSIDRRYSNLPCVGFHTIYSSVLQLILYSNLKLKNVLLSFSSVYCMLVSTNLKRC